MKPTEQHPHVEIWNPTIWNPETFEGQISNGPVIKWSGLSYGYSFSPYHLKTGPFKIWTFCPDFKWSDTKWPTFALISNGWAPIFQNSFEIQTICNLFDHSKSRLVCISDPHCILLNLVLANAFFVFSCCKLVK